LSAQCSKRHLWRPSLLQRLEHLHGAREFGVVELRKLPVTALSGSNGTADRSRATSLSLLDSAGAMRLMRANSMLSTPGVKRALVNWQGG
jgi:hypothetical protein